MELSSTNRSILIADDNPDTVESLSYFFKAFQFDVFAAYDGGQAIALARRRIPTAVILEMALPVVDGLIVARELRLSPELNGTSLVALSGHTEIRYLQQAQVAGMDYYLSKPADPELLIACVEPRKYEPILNDKVIIETSLQLRNGSEIMKAKGNALSLRSQDAVRRAQELCRKHWQV